MAFFAGMMNAMYFNKVKGTLKILQDHHDSSETDSTIFDEAKILDSTLYIPLFRLILELSLSSLTIWSTELVWSSRPSSFLLPPG